MHTAPRFVADVHLGRLARLLRMLGFDTAYEPDWVKPQLLKIAVTENRIFLTRDRSVAKNPFVHSLFIESERPTNQLVQVMVHFRARPYLQPFSRCMICNHPLQPVAKELVLHLLQPATLQQYQQFWQCLHCNRVYWQGSHYQRMLQHLKELNLA